MTITAAPANFGASADWDMIAGSTITEKILSLSKEILNDGQYIVLPEPNSSLPQLIVNTYQSALQTILFRDGHLIPLGEAITINPLERVRLFANRAASSPSQC